MLWLRIWRDTATHVSDVCVSSRAGMCQHSNGKASRRAVRAASERTISSDITCTLKTSICLAHLFPGLTRGSPPFALCVLSHTSSCSLPARQLPFFATVSFISTCLSHTHPHPPFPLCLCGFLYCICRISRLSSPSPSFFSSSFCRMFV